ncbi:MAG: hypothetical protein WCR55_13670 [Lentisphaerota bacterium]
MEIHKESYGKLFKKKELNKLVSHNRFILINTLTAFFIVITVITTLLYFKFDGKITGFFRIGDVIPTSPYLDKPSAYIFHNTGGHDGQQYLSISLDPALRNPGTIKALDNPKYRYRRIAYPSMGYIFGLGSPHFIPYAMVLINLLSFTCLILSISVYKKTEIPNSIASLNPLLAIGIPGLWFSLCLSTTDLFGIALVISAIVLIRRSLTGYAVILLMLACLTRETYIATVLAITIFMFAKNHIKKAFAIGMATLPALIWNIYVYFSFHGTLGNQENFGAPFCGIINKIKTLFSGALSPKYLLEVYCFTILLTVIVILIISVKKNWKEHGILFSAAFPSILILLISKIQILDSCIDYLRVFLDLFVIIYLLPSDKTMLARIRTLILCFCSFITIGYIIGYCISDLA